MRATRCGLVAVLVLTVVATGGGRALAASASSQSASFVEGSVDNWITLSGSFVTPASFTLDTPPTNGTIRIYDETWTPLPWSGTVNAYPYVLYTPSVGTGNTNDSFRWRCVDSGGASTLATCTITVRTNTPPVANNQAPSAIAQNSIRVGFSLNVTHPDSGQEMSYTLLAAPTNGVLEYSGGGYQTVPVGTPVSGGYWYYTPNSGYLGPDTFQWNVSDGMATSGPATCSMTVAPNAVPVARAQGVTVLAGTVRYGISLSYTHPDSYQSCSWTLVTPPALGTLEYYEGGYQPVPAGTPTTENYWYYTPTGRCAAVDTIVWSMNDGLAGSDAATCTVTIRANSPPIVNAPTQRVAVIQDTTNDLTTFLAYTHADSGQTMSYALLRAPTNGTLLLAGQPLGSGDSVASRAWQYVPAPGRLGGDSFDWRVSDGMDATAGTIEVDILAGGAPPAPPVFKSGVKLMDGTNVLALGRKVVNGAYDWAGEGTYGGRDNNIVMATPELADWNNDGLLDLLVGQADGRIALFLNKGTRGRPRFDGYEYLKLSNGKEIRTYLGGCVCTGGGPESPGVRVVDWDNDGRKDLLLGQWSGPFYGMNLFIYFNSGTDASPVFDGKVASRLSSNSGYPTSLPSIADWNGDGIPDLISGDNRPWGGSWGSSMGTMGGAPSSTVNIYLSSRLDHSPLSTFQGNCYNCECFNWDEYSLAGSLQSTSPSITPTNLCPADSRKSVMAVDWTGSGRKDVLTGRQDGTVWYAPNVGTPNFPAFTNCFRLQAGGSNIVVGNVSYVGQDPAYGGQGNMYNQAGLPARNEARIAVGDLDGDGLADLLVGDRYGNVTLFYQYNPNPVAVDQRVLVTPDAAKAITLAARLDNGHVPSFTVRTPPAHGTLSGGGSNLVYTPQAGYQGADCFTFTAADGTNDSAAATVDLDVRPHPPVARWISPVTRTSTAILNMNTSLVVTLTATGEGNDPLAYSIVSPPAHGTYTLADNALTYTPSAGFTGTDSFSYQASADGCTSTPATVTLDVCVLAVNFQPRTAPVPAGFRADIGTNYDAGRGYGWNRNLSAAAAQRNRDPYPLRDTVVWTTNATWTCDLPNGTYCATLVCGDAAASYGAYGPHFVWLQGAPVITNITTGADAFVTTNILVTVDNGQLVMTVGNNANNTGLAYLLLRGAYRPAGTAAFVLRDDDTQGWWKGVYGADGYKIVTGLLCPRGEDYTTDYVVYFDPYYELADTPDYVTMSGPPNGGWGSAKWKAWSFPSSDERALEYPTLEDERIAVYWYADPNKSLVADLAFTDGQTHRVAVYCLAWGNNSWAQRMEILDADDGTVLDTRQLADFGAGSWMVWDLSGHVKMRVTCTSGSAAVSGFFFGMSAPPAITVQPLDDAVQTGQNASFHVSASGQPLLYQWQRSNDGGATWADIPGATADTCTFATVPADHAARIRCRVYNSYGEAYSGPARLSVDSALPTPPVITSPLLVSCTYNQPFTYTITARNNPTRFEAFLPMRTFSLDCLTGVLYSSAPAWWIGYNTSWWSGPGTLYIPIYAMNAAGFDSRWLVVVVNATNAPVITSPLAVTGMVGVAFSYAIGATWNPTTYGAATLPDGLAFNPLTGLITGTPLPAATGTNSLLLSAGNANGTGLAYLDITILGAPAIAAQPADTAVIAGQPATFRVTATGEELLGYQWMRGGTNLAGATSSTFTIGAAALADAGVYSVAVSNRYRTVVSAGATLSITATAQPPVIVVQPAGVSCVAGSAAAFAVAASGTAPLAYQWRRNGVDIPGAVADTYAITSAATTDAATYSVAITNAAGSTVSVGASLAVTDSLLAWWKLDDVSGATAADSSGHGHVGVLKNTASWTNAGKFATALRLNGNNDVFVVPPAVSPAGGDWTLVAWFLAPLPASGTWHALARANSGDTLVITDGSLNLGMYDAQSGGAFRGCGYNLGVLSNGWHQVAAVGAGTSTTFYVDGACVGASDRKGGPDLYAVGNHASGGQRFATAIDDVRFYGRVLAPAEIAALSCVTSPPAITVPPTNLTAMVSQTASFIITATGNAPLAYQWRRNSAEIPGATNSAYTTPPLAPGDSGTVFSVTASNAAGVATSPGATLSVVPLTYKLTITTNGAGTGTVALTPADARYTPGTVVSLAATAAVSSTFASWTGALTGTNNPAAITLTNNLSVGATFTLRTFTITASAGANGSISPSGAQTVNYGAGKSFTMTPNTGYALATLTVDGGAVAASNSYAFANVTTGHTISVTFTQLVAAPWIVTHPTNATVIVGKAASFTAAANGTLPLCYQWMKGGVDIAGATSATYTISATAFADAGTFAVRVTNTLGSATSSNAALTVSDGFVAWWRLDETNGTAAADATGNSRTGTVVAGAAWSTGVFGNGLRLNGTNQYLITPALGSFGDETIAVWFYPVAAGVIASKHDSTTLPGSYHESQIEVLATGEVKVRVWNLTAVSVGTVSFNTWNHVALRYNYATQKLDGFLNGVASAGNSSGNVSNPGNVYFAFGATDSTHLGSGAWFTGTLDEVRIYKRPLSAAEIAALANPGAPPSITLQPDNVTVYAGQVATFTVNATGTPSPVYQWRRDGVPLAGATNTACQLATVAADKGARFSVVVSNACGSVTSREALLTVKPVAIGAFQYRSGRPDISFETETGWTYRIDWNSNLMAGSGWQLYTNVIGTGGLLSVSITNNLPQGFFRFQATP